MVTSLADRYGRISVGSKSSILENPYPQTKDLFVAYAFDEGLCP